MRWSWAILYEYLAFREENNQQFKQFKKFVSKFHVSALLQIKQKEAHVLLVYINQVNQGKHALLIHLDNFYTTFLKKKVTIFMVNDWAKFYENKQGVILIKPLQ